MSEPQGPTPLRAWAGTHRACLVMLLATTLLSGCGAEEEAAELPLRLVRHEVVESQSASRART